MGNGLVQIFPTWILWERFPTSNFPEIFGEAIGDDGCFFFLSKKTPTNIPGSNTLEDRQKLAVYEGNPESYVYFGVHGVCSTGLLELFRRTKGF